MVKVKIPQKIKIGAHTYAIKLSDTLESRGNKLGYTDITNGLIEIEKKQCETSKLDTLIHEALHSVNFYFCNKTLGEDVVEGIANAVTIFLTDLGIEFDWELIKEG